MQPTETHGLLSSRSNHLTSATVHRPEVLVELLSDGEVHVEVSECGDGVDLHGTSVGLVADALVGLQ